ncbi:MAG: hypothetical protein KDD66_00940 [Bdellovibrionales bacterium]|nr:hypothetical protein [Bdellovibrionales bacterium]
MPAIYLVTFVLAGCSILYELLIAQTLSILAGNTVIWYSLTIGLYLGSMGFGALIFDRSKSTRETWERLFQIELMLSVLGAMAPMLLHFGRTVTAFGVLNSDALLVMVSFFPATLFAVISVGVLSGIELPLLMRAASEREPEDNPGNRVLAADYLGSLAGGLLFPLVLVPTLSEYSIGFTVALVNLVAALIIFIWKLRSSPSWPFRSVLVAGIAICLLAGLVGSTKIEQYFLRRYYYYQAYPDSLSEMLTGMQNFPWVERHMSAYQKIDIVDLSKRDISDYLVDAYSKKYKREKDYPKGVALFINGDPQLFASFDEVYHEYFAHVPVIHHRKVPKKVLILGGGDSLLLKEIVKYRTIESITMVDIDPVMIELARSHPLLSKMNGGALNDPRLNLVIGDAYQFVKNSDEKYDAIYMDFPNASDYNVSRLYSREFYSFVRRRLADGGYAVMNANGIDELTPPDEYGTQRPLPGNEWPTYWSTIKAAGFENVKPYFSNLEPHNPFAYSIVENLKLIDLPSTATFDERALAISRFVSYHIYTLQYGFIMMYDGAKDPEGNLEDPKIRLDVLNSVRYQLAFRLYMPEPDRIDPSRVNSIMRPSILSGPLFSLRMPFMTAH